MMYGYNYGYKGMMGGGANFVELIVCAVVFIDLVLLGVWLWQNISKK